MMVKKSTENGSDSVAPFLKKCYEMVDDETTGSIISWSQKGESFVIWDATEFSVRLLPKYFKHSNFSSFMRQLNIYVRVLLVLFFYPLYCFMCYVCFGFGFGVVGFCFGV
jgi:hypothetical protein